MTYVLVLLAFAFGVLVGASVTGVYLAYVLGAKLAEVVDLANQLTTSSRVH